MIEQLFNIKRGYSVSRKMIKQFVLTENNNLTTDNDTTANV